MIKKHIKRTRGRVLGQILLIHLFVGLIFNLANNLGHPLYDRINSLPIWGQAALVSLVAFVVYMGVGYVLVISKLDKRSFFLSIDWALMFFTLIMLLVYGLVLFLRFVRGIRNVMLIYSIFNPLFGTYMYRMSDALIFSPWWLVSTIVPTIGIYVGTLIRLKHEEYRI